MILSALLGWAVVTAMQLGRGATWFQFFGLLPFAAVVGLPIAFLVAWILVGPILWRIMRHPVSWSRAARWGAVIAALVAAISVIIGRLNGYRISQDPSFHFWTAREVDGVLTPFGWKMLAIDCAIFIAIGAILGLLIRCVIGPGKTA
ncbi:MAG: hypothetical protein MUE83_08630 [Tabrizicola sp.]|jgi:hypothetical protein|nr:hypothetical protein [Tabrizicola sp.]